MKKPKLKKSGSGTVSLRILPNSNPTEKLDNDAEKILAVEQYLNGTVCADLSRMFGVAIRVHVDGKSFERKVVKKKKDVCCL